MSLRSQTYTLLTFFLCFTQAYVDFGLLENSPNTFSILSIRYSVTSLHSSMDRNIFSVGGFFFSQNMVCLAISQWNSLAILLHVHLHHMSHISLNTGQSDFICDHGAGLVRCCILSNIRRSQQLGHIRSSGFSVLFPCTAPVRCSLNHRCRIRIILSIFFHITKFFDFSE